MLLCELMDTISYCPTLEIKLNYEVDFEVIRVNANNWDNVKKECGYLIVSDIEIDYENATTKIDTVYED